MDSEIEIKLAEIGKKFTELEKRIDRLEINYLGIDNIDNLEEEII